MIGTYEVSLSTTNGMAGQMMLTLQRGTPLSWLDDLPKAVEEFAKSGGAAVWDFHVSDKVLSPTIRRAHPHKEKKG